MFTAFTDLIEQMLKYTFYTKIQWYLPIFSILNYLPELTQEKMNIKLLQS